MASSQLALFLDPACDIEAFCRDGLPLGACQRGVADRYPAGGACHRAKMRLIEQAMPDDRGSDPISLLAFERRGGVPLFRQLHERIRAAIESGELRPGARLPSSRVLAAQLPASRTSVQLAYDLLAAEGFIVGHGAKGTIVAPELATRPSPVRRAAPPGKEPGGPPLQSTKPFQLGLPALDAFPRKLWSRLAARAARQLSTKEMLFQPPLGLDALRHAIAGYLAIARGVTCTASQVLVTSGFQGALALVAAILVRPGDRVWVEDPGYFLARSALALLGGEPVPVPVDGQGLRIDVALALAADARLAVVTPSHQFPTGVSLSLPRRMALVDWARGTNGWIVEDDYDSEYRYLGRPLPALHGLDSGRVLYVGSFSKVLFPSLRLGYLVVPEAEVERFARARPLLDGHAPMLDQMTVAAFMSEGHFTRHIKTMRSLYAERRAALVTAIEDVLGDLVDLELTDGGMHLLARLPPGLSDVEVIGRATQAGHAGRALSAMAVRADPGQGLLLGFTGLPAEQARPEVEHLRRTILSSSQ